MKFRAFIKYAMICNKVVSAIKTWFGSKSEEKPEKTEAKEPVTPEEKKEPRISITSLVSTAEYICGRTKEIPSLPMSEYEKFIKDTMYETGNLFRETFAGSPYMPEDFSCFMQVLDDVEAFKECAESVLEPHKTVFNSEMPPEKLHFYVSYVSNNGLDSTLNKTMKEHIKFTVDKLIESPIYYIEYFKNYPQNKLFPWTLFVETAKKDLWDALECAFGKDVCEKVSTDAPENCEKKNELEETQEECTHDTLEPQNDLEDFPHEDTSCIAEPVEETIEKDDDGDPGITFAAMGNVVECSETEETASEEEKPKKKRVYTQEQRDRRNANRRKRYAELKEQKSKKEK